LKGGPNTEIEEKDFFEIASKKAMRHGCVQNTGNPKRLEIIF